LSLSGSFVFRSSHVWFTTVAHIPLPACAGIFALCSAWPTLLVLRVLHFPILANIFLLRQQHSRLPGCSGLFNPRTCVFLSNSGNTFCFRVALEYLTSCGVRTRVGFRSTGIPGNRLRAGCPFTDALFFSVVDFRVVMYKYLASRGV
jgi:hypothetical protein